MQKRNSVKMNKLVVATYNIHSCIGSDKSYDPLRIASVINKINPDIIGLQEVDTGYRINEKVHQVSILENKTGLKSIPGPTIKKSTGFYGNIILTSRPYEQVYSQDISQTGFEPRGILQVDFNINKLKVSFITTHFGLKRKERYAQASCLLSHIEQINSDITIVSGDLNIWCPLDKTSKSMNNRLGESPRKPSFPSRHPILALDRIWIIPESRLIRIYALNISSTRMASDHLPVIAEIEL